MLCHIGQRRFSELTEKFEDAAIRERLPYMGVLELTYRCNNACRHCYCNLAAHDPRAREELATGEARRILGEIAEAGCLWLVLSGGEALLRKDFPEIYLHALRRGMFVSVMTNGTLIDDAIAALFADYPPLDIDISVYGSCAAVHDAVTGVAGSFDRMVEGIGRLRRAGLRFSLKTTVMTLNLADLSKMRSLADSLGAPFRYDALLIPRLDRSKGPLAYRISPPTAAALEVSGEEARNVCRETFDAFWGRGTSGVVTCGAGIFSFNIDPYGTASPCTMFGSFRRSLREMPFQTAWREIAGEFAAAEGSMTPSECASCGMRLICPNCAAWAELETGRRDRVVPHLCSFAKELERQFTQTQTEEGRR